MYIMPNVNDKWELASIYVIVSVSILISDIPRRNNAAGMILT